MVTGNGNLRSYLHRFKIIETSMSPCSTTDRTIDHFLFECDLLNKERDNLILTLLKTDVWPIKPKRTNKETF